MLEIEPEVVGEDEYTYIYEEKPYIEKPQSEPLHEENPYIGLDDTYDQVPDDHFDQFEGQVRKT